MEKIKIGIIGAGNVARSKHLPALKLSKRVDIVGVMDPHEERAQKAARDFGIRNWSACPQNGGFSTVPWVKEVDALVVATPPFEHYRMAEMALTAGKHVLVEKPFTSTVEEGEHLIRLKNSVNKQLCVVHNFQFAAAAQKMQKILASGSAGKVKSFLVFQATNKTRRLPQWKNKLPLGLFTDETPHFFYLLRGLGGTVKVLAAHKTPSPDGEETPLMVTANLTAGDIPATLYINFDSPICEWVFIVYCERKLLLFDLFRDVLVVIPNDELHLAKNVLSNSWHFTFDHWKGTVVNGFKRMAGRLLYGVPEVYDRFLDAIEFGKVPHGITAEDGLEVVKIQHQVIDIVK